MDLVQPWFRRRLADRTRFRALGRDGSALFHSRSAPTAFGRNLFRSCVRQSHRSDPHASDLRLFLVFRGTANLQPEVRDTTVPLPRDWRTLLRFLAIPRRSASARPPTTSRVSIPSSILDTRAFRTCCENPGIAKDYSRCPRFHGTPTKCCWRECRASINFPIFVPMPLAVRFSLAVHSFSFFFAKAVATGKFAGLRSGH